MDLTINKVAAGVVGLAMVAGLAFAFTATRVHATSLAELVELFIALEVIAPEKAVEARAALAGMTPAAPTTPAPAGSVACTGTFNRNLKVGDTGADVMELQKLLNARGFTVATGGAAGSPGMETQYYGPATAGAVTAMQTAYAGEILTPLGLTMGTGFFGASTRAKANALCSATTPTTPTVPTVPGDEDEDDDSRELSGGEGYINLDVLLDSDIQLDLGDSEAVIEVELEAKDSDVAINRVDFYFDVRPWLYFDEVNLLMDGEEVASLSGSGDFTEVSGDYRARFSGLNYIIEEDETAELSLQLVVRSSMTGDRDQDPVEVWIPVNGIRAKDGAGIDQYVPEGTGSEVGPAVVTFDDAFGEGDISVTLSEKSPENAVIVLNESSRTSDVAVVYFNVEADNSDMEVSKVDVTFDVGTSSVANTLYRARLYAGNTLLSTQSVSASTTSFTGVDYMIDEDDEVEFRVEVDFNRADGIGSGISGAETFTVETISVTAENADYIEDTESLTVSEQHWVLVSGLVSEIVSVSSPVMTNDDKNAKYTFKFDVTAIEDTYYVAEDFDLSFIVSTSAANAVITGGAVTSNATVDGDTYRISKGQTREFTVEVFVTATGAAAVNRVTLEYMNFDLTKAGAEADGGDRQTLLGTPDFRSATANILAS